MGNVLFFVMPGTSRAGFAPLDIRGLDRRIHHLWKSRSKEMDCRVKPGNDGRDVWIW